MSSNKQDRQNDLIDNDDDEELNEEEIVQAILALGNDILKNLGVEEPIDDVGVFFSDAFYIQFFQAAFPNIDFSNMQEADSEEEMAANIQTLIDLLGQQILKYDLSHIRGEEIVSGNPEHCINLLQLVQEISVMLGQEEEEEGDNGDEPQSYLTDMTGNKQSNQKSSQQKQQQQQLEDEEDDEAQVIQERQPKRNRSASRDEKPRQGGGFFDGEELDISNDFEVEMDDDQDQDDDDDDHQQLHSQLQQQQIDHHQQQKQQQIEALNVQDDEDDEQDEDDEINEDDLKMYEQFLANNQNQQDQLAGAQQQQQHFGSAPGPIDMEDQDEDEDQEDQDDQEIDLDNIDYEDLDPQILELAEQMGVHPKEIIKQLQQLQSQGYGDEDDEQEQEDDEEDQQMLQQQEMQRQQQLKLQQQQYKEQSQQQLQQQRQQTSQKKKPLRQYYDDQASDHSSQMSEGELHTRFKLANKKSYSAPYIIINDCFDEPLYDSESQLLQKAYSTTMLQNLELQDQQEQMMDEGEGEDEEEMMMMQQQLMLQQQQQQRQIQQQQQQQQQRSSEKNRSSEKQVTNKSQEKSRVSQSNQKQQQQQFLQDDEDEDEMEIDVKQKLQQIQQVEQQQQQRHQQNQEDDDYDEEDDDHQQLQNPVNEDNEGEDDEEMLIDLDKLDEPNKQMLLEYLRQEYDKNPDQFPFPKELIEDYMIKQQQSQQVRQDTESIRDIKSDEMIVEDTQNQHHLQIDGQGEQEIEDDEEQLDTDQQQQLQHMQMLYHQQQQQQQDGYGEEDDQEDEEQVNLLPQQQQFQQQPRQVSKKGVKKGITNKGNRPKSAGRKNLQEQNALTMQQRQHQENLLYQQQMLAELLQNQNINAENIDPNLLQQLIIAQSQQQQQQQFQKQPVSRPRTAKRKSSAPKKKIMGAGKQQLSKLQPYQMGMPKSMKVLGPSTPGQAGFKPFVSNRSTNQTLSKKKPRKKSAKKQPISQEQQIYEMQNQQQQQQQIEMPVLSEDYLNQLSEEELQQLLEQQQQLMIFQQQQQQTQVPSLKKSLRPKSAKSKTLKAKIPQSYGSYYQPNFLQQKRKSASKGKKKKGTKKRAQIMPQQDQGVMLNNYFPALENNGMPYMQNTSQDGGQEQHYQMVGAKDQKYPKFSSDNINNQMYYQQQQDQVIDEVPPEQEEGESQELHQKISPNFYQQQQDMMQDENTQEDNEGQMMDDQDGDQDGDQDQDQDDGQEQDDPMITGENQNQNEGEADEELSDEQLMQLIQNAHNLSPEHQQQLQILLQQRMQQVIPQGQDRVQSYQSIYQILMDNVLKAKHRMQNLNSMPGQLDDVEETDRRILRQKQEFEALYRQYQQETKQRQSKKVLDNQKMHKNVMREQKIQAIKERKFQEDLLNHQKSVSIKRNNQQVKLCQKVYKLASDLEKNKLLAEKREYKETVEKKKMQNRVMVDAMESHYKNQIQMLKEKIENERLERKIAQQAQQQAMSRMKRELNSHKRQEVEKYLQILKQEDQRYDFESTNMQKLESEMVKLYKKQ